MSGWEGGWGGGWQEEWGLVGRRSGGVDGRGCNHHLNCISSRVRSDMLWTLEMNHNAFICHCILVVGGGWRLAVGGWRLAVGGPWGLSLRAVLHQKKNWSS